MDFKIFACGFLESTNSFKQKAAWQVEAKHCRSSICYLKTMEEYKHMEQETQIDVILMLSRESRIGVNGIDSNEAENANASSHHTLLRLDKDDVHIVVQSLEQQLCIKLHNRPFLSSSQCAHHCLKKVCKPLNKVPIYFTRVNHKLPQTSTALRKMSIRGEELSSQSTSLQQSDVWMQLKIGMKFATAQGWNGGDRKRPAQNLEAYCTGWCWCVPWANQIAYDWCWVSDFSFSFSTCSVATSSCTWMLESFSSPRNLPKYKYSESWSRVKHIQRFQIPFS